MASSPPLLSVQSFLSLLPPHWEQTELDTCHHIAVNIGNISQLLKHSSGPQCLDTQAQIPRPSCPTPDVPIPRAAIIPLIDQTIELCHIWRVNPQVSEIADAVEESMTELRAHAGDNLAALELEVLKALRRPALVAEPDEATVSLDGNPDDRFYELSAKQAGLPLSRYKRKLERGQINFGADGKPVAIRKRDVQKARKAAEFGRSITSPAMAIDPGVNTPDLIEPLNSMPPATAELVEMEPPRAPVMPQISSTQMELIQESKATMTSPGINISIPDRKFRLSVLRGMQNDDLKALLEHDLCRRGISVPIEYCGFRSGWSFIYLHFFGLDDAATVKVIWKPKLLGLGAFIEMTEHAGIPPFLSPKEESKHAARLHARARHVMIVIPNAPFAKLQLAKLEGSQLKRKIKADLKEQGIEVSINRVKKSKACTMVRLWTVEVEDVQALLQWKPNLQQLFGEGACVRT
ncbi:MAG: hypothetical protein Q9186_003015 [Xanthomendoza sp. 1 TL-2023]